MFWDFFLFLSSLLIYACLHLYGHWTFGKRKTLPDHLVVKERWSAGCPHKTKTTKTKTYFVKKNKTTTTKSFNCPRELVCRMSTQNTISSKIRTFECFVEKSEVNIFWWSITTHQETTDIGNNLSELELECFLSAFLCASFSFLSFFQAIGCP